MKILIIEDEPGIISFLRQGLEEEGFEVKACTDGEKGLQLMLEEAADLVLLDWMLPSMPGIEVCRRFDCRTASLP